MVTVGGVWLPRYSTQLRARGVGTVGLWLTPWLGITLERFEWGF
jgi:hypothetical protein